MGQDFVMSLVFPMKNILLSKWCNNGLTHAFYFYTNLLLVKSFFLKFFVYAHIINNQLNPNTDSENMLKWLFGKTSSNNKSKKKFK